MILQALYDYYQILLADPDLGISPPGYSATKVSYILNLSQSGELIEILPLYTKFFDGKKEGERLGRTMIVPDQVKRSVNISANFLCDNATYVLGITQKEAKDPNYAYLRFEAFRRLHNDLLANLENRTAQAIVKFLQSHDPDSVQNHPLISHHIDGLLAGGNLLFFVEGSNPVDDPLIRQVWEQYRFGKDSVQLQCLVTGEIEPIARLHPSIKGVRGAQSTGASLVSFNLDAFESYNLKQGLNSPVSQKAASGYGVALNYLLSDQNPNRKIHLGDTTVVYWAQSKDRRYASIFAALITPEFQQQDEQRNEYMRDKRGEKQLGVIAQKVEQIKAFDLNELRKNIDENTRFYVLGIAPSAARLAVRFFLTEPFGVFADRIMQHYDDSRIVKEYPQQPDYLSPYRILSECVSPKVRQREEELKVSWSLLGGSLIRCILTGAPYPEGLYVAIINRIKHDSDDENRSIKINYARAAYIKAHLIRKYRRQNTNPYQEALRMTLNESYNHPAYVLGRLFAVLEKAQKEALGQSINATIKDRYFTSACASPASVFPTLLRLSHHHTAKAEYGGLIDRQIQGLLDLLEAKPFPNRFTLEEQGIFVLGYYHQRAAFYAKSGDSALENVEGENN